MTLPPASGAQALAAMEVEAVSFCMRTLRSVREFLAVEVDECSLHFVLQHAVQAGSAKNRQPWRFIVVRDREKVSELGDWYRRGWQRMLDHLDSLSDTEIISDEHRIQIQHGVTLADAFNETPVVIAACFVPIDRNPANFYGGASIYPAVQNLLLAARAIGLGATLTTLQSLDALPSSNRRCLTGDLRAILGIPDNVMPAALIPMGWPAVPVVKVRRLPPSAVTYTERWGIPWNYSTDLAGASCTNK